MGVTPTGLLLVGIRVAAEVDGVGLRLSVDAAALSGNLFRPELPPTLLRLLDTIRLRICDKLVDFITTQVLYILEQRYKFKTVHPLLSIPRYSCIR